MENNQRISTESGYPLAIYGMKHALEPSSPESMARTFLFEKNKTLNIGTSGIENLKLHATRESLAGTVVRLRQYYQGLPVNKAEVTLHINTKNEATYLMNGYRYGVNIKNVSPSIPEAKAQSIAYLHLNIKGAIQYQKNELFIYHNNKSRLAYKIRVMAKGLAGEWEVLVDAHTGKIFKAQDVAFYCNGKHEHNGTCKSEDFGPPAMLVDGTGNVFDPDPLSSAMVAYGGAYVDNNDANSAVLTAETFNITLLDLTFDGTNYSLSGPYAQIVDFDAPTTGLFSQTSPNFDYQRSDQAFEAVNIYYHIDASMRYINETLNCPLRPYQYATGGVKYDPHGADGADNSFYTSGSGQLSFGEGCVDDGEDSDVIHHELGHGLHDWLTNGGLSQTNGLSEGCGDYWAQSYNRSLGNWTSSDAAYNYVFNWDGHNTCWNGRTSGYAAVYPGGLVGQIHTDGQIWATCLMKIYDQIGRAQTDKIFLEGLTLTNSGSSQDDAANAAYQAGIDMGYSSADLDIIHAQFTECGYTLPARNIAPIATFDADRTVICLDDPDHSVNFTDSSIGDPTSWSWTFTGGTPASSSLQNPTVDYDVAGTYEVSLTATNAIGATTETKTGFITVVSGAACPSCLTYTSADVPVTISESGTPTVTSTLTINDSGEIIDVNVLNLEGTHTFMGDLHFTLISPNNTSVVLFADICGTDENFDVDLDDDALSATLPCPPVDGLAYQPSGSLASFNGEEMNGTWTLSIFDDFNQDGGELTAWSLEICKTSNVLPVSLVDFDVKAQKGAALVNWTAYEQNIDFYQIERSLDQKNWTNVGQVTAKNSSSKETYEFLDNDLPTLSRGTVLYYRLHIIETSKASSYSDIRSLTINESNSQFVVAPNPTSDLLFIKDVFGDTQAMSVQVFDVTGQLVLQQQLQANKNEVALNLANLPIGVYMLKIDNGKKIATERIVKQ